MNKQTVNADKALFDQQGYLDLKNYLSNDEFSQLSALADELEQMPEEIGGPMKYFEKTGKVQEEALNRVEKFAESSKFIQELIKNNLIPLLKRCLGKDYLLFKDKINFKMPNAGGFKPHQDAPAFTKFIQEEMVTIMIPLQETNAENGYLEVNENTFIPELIKHENGTLNDDILESVKWKGLPQQKRDILLFSSLLIHKSERNLSTSSRRCYFLTFNPASLGDSRNEYFNFKRENFPPRIERNQVEIFKDWQGNLARDIY